MVTVFCVLRQLVETCFHDAVAYLLALKSTFWSAFLMLFLNGFL